MEKETKPQGQSLDVDTAFDRLERYFNENRKSLLIIGGSIVALVALFFGWKYIYQKPREKAAVEKSWKAEQLFMNDSIIKAIKGGKGDTIGLEKIIRDYGSTTQGNLARYELGVGYLRTGKYKEAIEQLKEFESDDIFVGTLAIGCIGDAYMELGNTDEAINYYLKAADRTPNRLTTPMFLKKAGIAYEEKKNNAEANKLYQRIKKDFPESTEAVNISKYIERTGGETSAK